MPSAKVKTLDKEDTWPKSVHFGPVFAECPDLTLGKAAMFVSVRDLTLDKSAKFAECPCLDTRQTWAYLQSVRAWAIGKHGCFAECQIPDTRQTRRDSLYVVMLLFFCQASVSVLGKVFAECPIKNTRQRDVYRHCRCRVLFAECYTRQILCRVFFGLCRVPVAHGKATVSGSVSW